MTIYVVKPGLLTTVQDTGRYGYQQYGVIVSGAMDAHASACANALVGNDARAALLELTLTGPELRFEQSALIAICGADLTPTVDGELVPMNKPVWLQQGARLQFGAARHGVRAYVAFAGGLQAERRMGSCATYLRAGLGGYEGRALRAGDRLHVGQPSAIGRALTRLLSASPAAQSDRPLAAPRWSAAQTALPRYTARPLIRFIAGAHYSLFDEQSREAWMTSHYRVTPRSDRMGCRLEGRALRLGSPLELFSEPVAFGTVQVPPDGMPIILTADRQTTGGYPMIAQIISVDLPLVAQTPFGGAMTFRETTIGEAQRLWTNVQRELQHIRLAVRMIARS